MSQKIFTNDSNESAIFDLLIKKSIKFCDFQERSVFQTEQKLKEWGANNMAISKVIKYLNDNNFINQERFVEMFVNGKFKYNKWGKIKIFSHLRGHKIPDGLINKYLNLIDDTLYRELISKLIIKKNIELNNESNLQLKKQKIIQYCLSKGFEMEYVMPILNSLT